MPDETTNAYNEKFAIPEMIKTFKALCNRLQRDLFFIMLILAYVFIVKKLPVAGLKEELDYKGNNIIYVFVIFNVFYLFVVLHLFKIFILYRQIDDEVKMFYAGANKDIYSRIDSSSAMTAFVLSDNITADLILAGHRRHPSLKRLIFLQATALCMAFLLTCRMINDYSSATYPWFSFLALFAGYLIALYLLTDRFFIKRSAFLQKSSFLKKAFIACYHLLSFLQMNSKLKQFSKEIKEECEELLAVFQSLDLSNIGDFEKDRRSLKNYQARIKEIWARMPSNDKSQLAYDEVFEGATNENKTNIYDDDTKTTEDFYKELTRH